MLFNLRSVLVCSLTILLLTASIPAPLRADFNASEAIGTLGGGLAGLALTMVAGPLGIVAGGIVGGLASAMIFGVGVEKLFLSNSSVSNKEQIVYTVAAIAFILAAPLAGMLVVQAPILGILSGAILGASVGMQMGQSYDAPKFRPDIAVGTQQKPTIDRVKESLAVLREKVDKAKHALDEALSKARDSDFVRSRYHDFKRAAERLQTALTEQ